MSKKQYSVTLTEPLQKGLEELINRGLFMDPQNVIRESLRATFERYGVDPFSYPVKEAGD